MKRILKTIYEDKYLLIVVALSICSIGIVSLANTFTMGPDGIEYIAPGHQLFQPDIYGISSTYIAPLYPTFSRIMFFFKAAWVYLWFQLLLGFLVPVIIYISLKPFDKTAAFVTAAITSLNFNNIFHFPLVCPEPFYTFLLSIILFSFCRLLKNPNRLTNIYLYCFSFILLALTRSAGVYLFLFTLPFLAVYFKSWKIIKRVIAGLLIPWLLYILIWNNLGLVKFPQSLYLLFFAQRNGLVDYERGSYIKQLVDVTEKIYFKEELPEKGKKRFITDMENYYTDASVILFYSAISPHPDEFNKAVVNTVKESLSMDKILSRKLFIRNIVDAINFSSFKLLERTYSYIFNSPQMFGLDYNNYIESGLKDMDQRYKEKYGAYPEDEYIKFRYRKYAKIDYSMLFQKTRNPTAAFVMLYINRIFIPMFTFFVFFLSFILIILQPKNEKEKLFSLTSIFGLILIGGSTLVALLPGGHERYRTVLDLFYFIPVGWLYANLLRKGVWSVRKKIVIIFLLVLCIFLNSQLEILRTYIKGIYLRI